MSIPRKHNNVSDNYELYMDKKCILEKQMIDRDHKNLIDKRSDAESYARDSLLGHMPQDRLFASDLLSFRKVWFSEKEFYISKPVLDIKYYYLDSENNNLFQLFND